MSLIIGIELEPESYFIYYQIWYQYTVDGRELNIQPVSSIPHPKFISISSFYKRVNRREGRETVIIYCIIGPLWDNAKLSFPIFHYSFIVSLQILLLSSVHFPTVFLGVTSQLWIFAWKSSMSLILMLAFSNTVLAILVGHGIENSTF